MRWKGPATVVVKEPNSHDKTSWLVQGTFQVRCSSVHVRPDFADVVHSCTDNLELARTQLGVSGITQFTDLTLQRQPAEDLSDEEMPDLATPPVEAVPQETVPQPRDPPSTPPQQPPPPSTPVPLPQREASPTSAHHMTVAPCATENLDPPASSRDHSRVRANSSERPASEVSHPKRPRLNTKSPPDFIARANA